MFSCEIYELVKKYKIPNFLGVYMKDNLMQEYGQTGKLLLPNNSCCVTNFQNSYQEGSHWVCFYKLNGKTYYFDSYGERPPVNVSCEYNTFRVQYDNQHCGLYCLYILVECFKYKKDLLKVCLNLKP